MPYNDATTGPLPFNYNSTEYNNVDGNEAGNQPPPNSASTSPVPSDQKLQQTENDDSLQHSDSVDDDVSI